MNRTLTKICVTGNDRKHNPVFDYLSPGESSSGKMYDVDGVVIIPGQNFYDNRNCTGLIYKSGIIKVIGGILTAEVRISKNDPIVYFVDAYGTEYHTLNWAEDEEWKLP